MVGKGTGILRRVKRILNDWWIQNVYHPRKRGHSVFSLCVCLFFVCPDDLTMKDWYHTNHILQKYTWGCLVVLYIMFWLLAHLCLPRKYHYSDVTISKMASQITGESHAYSAVCLGAYQRKRQSSASMATVRGNHRSPVDSLHKGPVTRKMFHLMTASCLL